MKVYIKAISYYLPEQVITNDDLSKEFPEWNTEKISSKIGVDERHIAADGETAGDMAEKVTKLLIENNRIDPAEIDFILFCTQSPDYFLPTTACLLQSRLGIPTTAGALDFNLGCSGYVYGLSLAKGLIAANIAKNVLLLTAETYNKYIHPLDKGNRTIFGDGASATLISSEGFAAIEEFVLGTDGRGAENLIVRSGASRCKEIVNDLSMDENGALISSDHLYMNGSEIFTFTLDTVPLLLKQVIDKNGLTSERVNHFVFHQANKFMLNTLRKLCGISYDKFYINMRQTGNTVSSTLPIAIQDLNEGKQLQKGDKVALLGFGVGYSWGGCVITIQ